MFEWIRIIIGKNAVDPDYPAFDFSEAIAWKEG